MVSLTCFTEAVQCSLFPAVREDTYCCGGGTSWHSWFIPYLQCKDRTKNKLYEIGYFHEVGYGLKLNMYDDHN